jgi:serine/threonine protein kinase
MARLADGARLDEFRIERLLDTGGMGEIYLAEDTTLGRRVAIKVLPEHLSEDETFRHRFERESRIAASLEHPNVVTVYSSGNVDGVVYIAMRYVPGTNLGALMARGRVDRPTLLRILGQVAGALDAAHAIGLVHRDVKPGNILVKADPEAGAIGDAYLADFGLARNVAGERTTEGHPMGTVHYVAPEQIQEQPTDGRADVYALGCVLFEALTGRVPYPSEDARAELMRHLTEAPPSASALDASLPGEVDEVIRRALAKDPAGRYASCSDLVAAAAEALSHAAPIPTRPDAAPTEPVAVPGTGAGHGSGPVGGSGPKTRTTRTRPGWLIPAAVGGAVGIVAIVIALAIGGDPPPDPPPPPPSDHVPGLGTFPNAGEQQILDRLPDDIRSTCVRMDGVLVGEIEGVQCVSGPQVVGYRTFDSVADAESTLDDFMQTKGIPKEGDCERDQPAYHRYSAPYGEGLVACFDTSDWTEIDWTWSDPGGGFVIYSWVYRTDFEAGDIYSWWLRYRVVSS